MEELKLPLSVTGRKELISIQRELELINEKLIEHKVVASQLNKKTEIPALSDVTNELLYLNQLKLDRHNISDLIKQLQHIKDSSPMCKVSFAVEPDRSSIAKIVGWFRKEIDPTLLIQVGIQPSIAGGVTIQTPGHRYDFSLRKHIMTSQDKFKAVIARDIFKKDSQENEQPASTSDQNMQVQQHSTEGEVQ